MLTLLHLSLQEWRLLLRIRLTAMVVASVAVGYLLAAPGGSAAGLWAMLAVALLSSGCTVLNQLQERDLDAGMRRTAGRPLASGRLHPGAGLGLALLLIAGGLLLLAVLDVRALAAGILAVIWYNGVYTPLKRRSALAVLPGSVCGALPPLIGWLVAGGDPGHPSIGILCGLLVLWQIPHFLLFISRHRDDYRQVGLPVFASAIPVARLRGVLTLWLGAVACSGLLLPAFGILRDGMLQGVVVLLAAALLLATWWFGRQAAWGRLFMPLNLFMGLLLALLAWDHLLPFAF